MGERREAEHEARHEAQHQTEIDAWLRGGGMVVTASDRAARALSSAFHRARRSEGLSAWPAPNVLDWKSFVRTAWEARSRDGRLLLNVTQEQSLWAEIAGADGRLATLLEGPRHRLSALAMEAHELLCGYAPQYLRPGARAAWQQDAAAFSNWLASFDEVCRSGSMVSAARLPLELIPLLEEDRQERPQLLVVGFDRILPTQRAFFEAWGGWRHATPVLPAAQNLFHQAADEQSELAACAHWCKERLAANPAARLLVVTQNAASQPSRGQMERAFLRLVSPEDAPLFEFSLGVPLSQVAHSRGALLLLRWLTVPLAEHELDWLFATGQSCANAEEALALQARMRALRQRGLEQPDWGFDGFVRQRTGSAALPAPWVNRIAEAQSRLAEFMRRPSATASPLDWAELVPRLLESAGWPGPKALSSAEFQAVQRFHQAVEETASLGFDGRRIRWAEFLSILARTLDETLFAPESRDAPIQIAGLAESAGLTADAIWFLGASEEAWPACGATHPLLPLDVQRQAGMPHATAQLDWELAQAITARLIGSAAEVHFSYARQTEDIEARPSRLIAQFVGVPEELPQALAEQQSLTVLFEDASRIPFPSSKLRGGAGVLTWQSQCPFKAFAGARLGAQGWKPAEAGLTSQQRGQLLHDVLHAVWGGPPEGIRSHRELVEVKNRNAFVAGHVRRIFQGETISRLSRRMPQRYLELEQQRLTELVTDWLEYEAARIGFDVVDTEADRTIHLAGLTFDVRLDRIDRIIDDSLLVIDYKSGNVSLKSWELPRPEDVQLPLYGGFALNREDENLGGLVFAKVRAGDLEFAGHVGDPMGTLFAGLNNRSSLAKNPLTAEQLLGWREYIEELASEFVAGRADVDPRDAPKTCERCGLQTLCRIHENEELAGGEDEDSSDEGEAGDE
jgi:probable DNA repair protein